jgi:predicted ATPase
MTVPSQKSVVCPVLIDRVGDLATLQELIDQVRRGSGQVVLLSGEAGIGKTRLVAEVKTEALAQSFQVVQGSCFPTDRAIPYAPLLDLLRSLCWPAPPLPCLQPRCDRLRRPSSPCFPRPVT